MKNNKKIKDIFISIGISILIAIIIWFIPLIGEKLSYIYTFDVSCNFGSYSPDYDPNKDITHIIYSLTNFMRIVLPILTIIIGPFIVYKIKLSENKNLKKITIIILSIILIAFILIVSINNYKFNCVEIITRRLNNMH